MGNEVAVSMVSKRFFETNENFVFVISEKCCIVKKMLNNFMLARFKTVFNIQSGKSIVIFKGQINPRY